MRERAWTRTKDIPALIPPVRAENLAARASEMWEAPWGRLGAAAGEGWGGCPRTGEGCPLDVGAWASHLGSCVDPH